MSYRALPVVLEKAIVECREKSQPLVRNALIHLWFDACKRNADGSVFVQTGDIPAMWIRDSTWQISPILRFANDPEIASVIAGVIQSQVKFLSIDPYANAFNNEPNGSCWHKDFEDQSPWVFERKWELDSISGFLELSVGFAVHADTREHLTTEWFALVERILDLLEAEQHHDPKSYRFVRNNAPAHDYLSHDGYGAPFKPCGLVWDAFRPSDDACELPFHVPSNMHLESALAVTSELILAESHPKLAKRAKKLSKSIRKAIRKHAIVKVNGRKLFAYEVDGLGGRVLMDDANYPSLASELPWLSWIDQRAAANTEAFIYSPENPWYFTGTHAQGVGSPHTGQDMVWPLGIAMRGLRQNFTEGLELIEKTVTGDLNIHESFNVNDPSQFTREWFSWAEMTYVELAFSEREARQTGQ